MSKEFRVHKVESGQAGVKVHPGQRSAWGQS